MVICAKFCSNYFITILITAKIPQTGIMGLTSNLIEWKFISEMSHTDLNFTTMWLRCFHTGLSSISKKVITQHMHPLLQVLFFKMFVQQFINICATAEALAFYPLLGPLFVLRSFSRYNFAFKCGNHHEHLRLRQNSRHFADNIFNLFFSGVEIVVSLFEFKWNLFTSVELTISQYGFR